MSDVTWVRVSSERDIARIGKLNAAGCNTYSASTDKTGAVIIPLGYDSRPDSDWGRYTRGNIIIRVTDEKLLAMVEKAVRRLLNLSGDPVIFATQEAGRG